MFSKKQDTTKLLYVRCKINYPFSFFDITPEDACEFITALESLDRDLTEHVHLRTFQLAYCSEQRETLYFIWEEYFHAVTQILSSHQKNVPTNFNPDYLSLSCFLMFFSSIEVVFYSMSCIPFSRAFTNSRRTRWGSFYIGYISSQGVYLLTTKG